MLGWSLCLYSIQTINLYYDYINSDWSWQFIDPVKFLIQTFMFLYRFSNTLHSLVNVCLGVFIIFFLENAFLQHRRALNDVAFPFCVYGQSPAAVMVIEGYFQKRSWWLPTSGLYYLTFLFRNMHWHHVSWIFKGQEQING